MNTQSLHLESILLKMDEIDKKIDRILVEYIPDRAHVTSQTIPDFYITISNFSRKYKFVSAGAIGRWIYDNKDFFKNSWIKEKEIYVDPYKVVEFVLRNDKRNPCLSQMHDWAHFIPELKKIIDSIKV